MDRRLGFALGAALVLVVVAVIALSGGGGGDPECPTPDTTAAEQAGFPVSPLEAVEQPSEGECAATGQVVLSVTRQQAFMQTNATGLEASSGGDSYVLWLYRSDEEATPLGRQEVDATGNLTGAAPLTTQEVALLPAYQSVRLSVVSQAEAEEVEQTLLKQRKAPLAVTRFVGVPVLEGPVPQLDLGGGTGGGGNGTGAGSKKK